LPFVIGAFYITAHSTPPSPVQTGPVAFLFTVSKTADYQILATDNGTQFDNNRAARGITFTLPPWAPNLRFSFVVAAPWPVSVVAPGTNKIGIGGLSFRSASSPMPVQLFSSVSIGTSNLPGTWIVNAQTGAWTMATLY
jgi:hypothetical protein